MSLYSIIISDSDKMDKTMMSQGLISIPGTGIGTYALLPMKSMYDQVSKAILPGKENEGRIYGLFQGQEQTFFGSYLNQQWNTICIILKLRKSEKVKIYLNGELRKLTLPATSLNPKEGNLEMMGYKLLETWMPFSGSMTDLNIWKRNLKESEIKSYDNCEFDEENNKIISWESAIVNVTNVQEIKVDKKNICKKDIKKFLYLASEKKANFDDALEYCLDVVGGEMAVIENEESTSRIVQAFNSIPDRQSKCFTRFWNGYTKEENELSFKNPNNNKLAANFQWMNDEPRDFPGDVCPMFDIVQNSSLSKECHHLKCPICKVPEMKKYTLRGVCIGETWLADIFYYLKQEKVLIGNMQTKITWSSESKRWEIQALKDNSIIAFMNDTNNYPFGKHQWFFKNLECTDSGQSFRTLLLHQEVDQPGKFCCDDGKCIDSELVCDNNQHCNDNTDESNCNMIQFSEDYDPRAPPSERIKDKRQIKFTDTKVIVDVYIYFLMEINEEDSSWSLLFSNTATWKDHRLNFNFLKNNRNPVKENFTNLWQPNMGYSVILDDRGNLVKELNVVKQSKPTIFDGSDKHHPQGKVEFFVSLFKELIFQKLTLDMNLL